MEKTRYLDLPLVFLKRPRGRITACFRKTGPKKKKDRRPQGAFTYQSTKGSVSAYYQSLPRVHAEVTFP